MEEVECANIEEDVTSKEIDRVLECHCASPRLLLLHLFFIINGTALLLARCHEVRSLGIIGKLHLQCPPQLLWTAEWILRKRDKEVAFRTSTAVLKETF